MAFDFLSSLVPSMFGGQNRYEPAQVVNAGFNQQLADAVQAEGQRQGISLPNVPQQKPTGLLDNPAFGDALTALGASLAAAGERGVSTGAGLALGAQGFNQAYRARQDRIDAAQRQATQDQLAYLKDIAGLRLNREQADLQQKTFDRNMVVQDRGYELDKQRFAQDTSNAAAGRAIQQAQLGLEQQKFAIQNATTAQLLNAAKNDPTLANLTPEGIQTVLVDRAKKAAEQTQNRQNAVIPGLQLQPNANPTADDVKVAKQATEGWRALQPFFDEREKLIKKYGYEMDGTAGAALLKQNTDAINLQVKQLFQTGALDRGSVEVISSALGDPVHGQLNSFNPISVGSRLLNPNLPQQQFKAGRKLIDDTFNATLKTRGFEQVAPQQASSGNLSQPVTVNSQAEYDKLPSGAVYRDSSGRQAVKR